LKPYRDKKSSQQIRNLTDMLAFLAFSDFVNEASKTRTGLTDLDVQLQRHRPDIGVEVECGRGTAAQPVGYVFGIGQR